MKQLSIALVLCAFVASCGNGDADIEAARSLAQSIIITDGHVDLPYRLNESWADVSVRTSTGNFDYVRAREGGLDAPFISIYTASKLEGLGQSREIAESLIDMVEGLADSHPDKFAIAVSPDDIRSNFEKGLVSFCLGMENGAPIEGALENVQHFHDRGIRYITLTHDKDNHICDSSYDTTRTWRGLSEFGGDVVREMNRVGIMVDVSHVSDDAFWQIMDITKAPVIASHSSCRKFLPGFERNLDDEMIRKVAEGGGVVQINFGSTFITQAARKWRDVYKREQARFMAENGVAEDSPEASAWGAEYRSNVALPYASVEDVADHFEHVVSIVGIDHVGFGSDFDGVGDSLPVGLKDVSQYPNLIAELMRRGFSEGDIKKIAHENVFRVWSEVERVAETL